MFVIACIPTFNEGKVIANLINDVSKHVDSIVVCDDGSTDKTYEKAELAGAICLKHKKNLGKGAALKSLFEYARNCDVDIIITHTGAGAHKTKLLCTGSCAGSDFTISQTGANSTDVDLIVTNATSSDVDIIITD